MAIFGIDDLAAGSAGRDIDSYILKFWVDIDKLDFCGRHVRISFFQEL